jgi:hypothetical protein
MARSGTVFCAGMGVGCRGRSGARDRQSGGRRWLAGAGSCVRCGNPGCGGGRNSESGPSRIFDGRQKPGFALNWWTPNNRRTERWEVSDDETDRSRFLYFCSQTAGYYGADSTTVLLLTAPVSVDVALAVLLTKSSSTSCAIMV